MPPVPYAQSNYDSNFEWEDLHDDEKYDQEVVEGSLTQMAFWYMIVLISTLVIWLFVFFCLRIIAFRQKTRRPQERRGVYAGSRVRQPSFAQQEPTIYVSPSNLPPPPKYECMAPPSYEEVVGVHYPQYQIQPITQPIATAMTNGNRTSAANVTSNSDAAPSTVVTVTASERRTSVTVATS